MRFQIGAEYRLSAQDPRWGAPFPLSPSARQISSDQPAVFTYGGVCGRFQEFLLAQLKRSLQNLPSVVFSDANTRPPADAEITIIIEKHGRYYHPCRLIWQNSTGLQEKALILALGERALGRLAIEADLIKALKAQDIFDSLPRIDGFERLSAKTPSNPPMAVMIGEWCHGYHEFHYSVSPDSSATGILIWSDEKASHWLDHGLWHTLYFQVAATLTAFFNPLSGEEIFPWHHAAGDFIISVRRDQLSLKLISVRQYAVLQNPRTLPEPRFLNGILLFFLNLSIRTRIDRLDGIGSYHWAPSISVRATLEGLLHGLQVQTTKTAELQPSLADDFFVYLKTFNVEDLMGLLQAVGESYHPQAPDHDLILTNLAQHAHDIAQAVVALDKQIIRD